MNLLHDIPDTWPILVVSTWEEPSRGDIGDMIIDHGDPFGAGVARKGSSGSSGNRKCNFSIRCMGYWLLVVMSIVCRFYKTHPTSA